MSRDFDDLLRAWTDEGEDLLPASYLGAALRQVAETPQASDIALRRWRWRSTPAGPAPVDKSPLRLGIVAAAIVVLAALIGYLALGLNVGRPEPTPSPARARLNQMVLERTFVSSLVDYVGPDYWDCGDTFPGCADAFTQEFVQTDVRWYSTVMLFESPAAAADAFDSYDDDDIDPNVGEVVGLAPEDELEVREPSLGIDLSDESREFEERADDDTIEQRHYLIRHDDLLLLVGGFDESTQRSSVGVTQIHRRLVTELNRRAFGLTTPVELANLLLGPEAGPPGSLYQLMDGCPEDVPGCVRGVGEYFNARTGTDHWDTQIVLLDSSAAASDAYQALLDARRAGGWVRADDPHLGDESARFVFEEPADSYWAFLYLWRVDNLILSVDGFGGSGSPADQIEQVVVDIVAEIDRRAGRGQPAEASETASPTTSPAPSIAPTDAEGAFQLAYSLDGDIYLADWDGADPVRIADGDTAAAAGCRGYDGPEWSPDGRYVSYRSSWSDACPGTVAISDAEGRPVASFPGMGWHVAWAPDSTRVATWIDLGRTIGVYGLDGVRQAFLTVPQTLISSGDTDPVWAPDGVLLVPTGIKVPLDGADPVHVPAYDYLSWNSVSPDGTRVAGVGGVWLKVAAADGSNPRRLFSSVGIGEIAFLIWSPAGDRIAFEVLPGDGTEAAPIELRVVHVASGLVTRLGEICTCHYAELITFSPDGDRILFWTTNYEGAGALWSVTADGSSPPRRLVEGSDRPLGDWQPRTR